MVNNEFVIKVTSFWIFQQLSTIGRCEYEKTCALLIQLFDTAAQEYQKLAQANATGVDVAIQEGEGLILLGCMSCLLMSADA